MTDIVERLQHDADSFNDCCLLCSEAADEIERNRAAIAELVAALKDAQKHHMTTSVPQAIEQFGSIIKFSEFGSRTWFETVPNAIAKNETPTTTKEEN